MRCLMLRFDAPLMSFGGVLVDQHNRTDRFPGRAMLTGLIANALGWHHGDAEALNELQSRIEYAARWDVPPTPLRDYHTVDLGQPHLVQPGWTTRGVPEHREGGEAAKKGTHQRYRHYWADGVMTLALALREGSPDLDAVTAALQHPARPLFLGRKTCLPAGRLVLGQCEAANTLSALGAEPRDRRASPDTERFEACWPPGCEDAPTEVRQRENRTDERDWRIQAHVGLRPVIVGHISEVPPCT
ncbi:CRISPR-associated Cas5 family protein [Salinisphaera sp. PC39]|uniref:type I-E CRISPR-associated protein Cas5/CasD n=1 Tax=Salinisphaera sp. PC39 TaxID=1304156 RepID=UPI00334040C9